MASVDGQTIWYILDDITRYLGDYRNILALIGIFYFIEQFKIYSNIFLLLFVTVKFLIKCHPKHPLLSTPLQPIAN